MKFDRAAFLTLATALSAVACSAGSAQDEETADELNRAACVDATKDALEADIAAGRAYPVLEGCYSAGETWGQCDAWVNHFEVGTARAALELKTNGKDAYDAGYEALRSSCVRDPKSESQIASTCKAIVKMQVDSGAAIWGHAGGVEARDPEKAAKLTSECVSLLRGIKQESRTVIRACVKKDPTYGVYSCVEGMGFDTTKAKCVDPATAISGNRTFDCSGLGGASCEAVKALFTPATAEGVLGCVEESIIIRSESGLTTDIAKEHAACVSFNLKRSCTKPEAAATCEEITTALKAADAELTDKGHINAGGAFTKMCGKMLSGLNEDGRFAVKGCLVAGAAKVVKSKLTIDQCAASVRADNGSGPPPGAMGLPIRPTN